MDAIKVLDDVVDRLTGHFGKCRSVNCLYRMCRKTVETKLAGMKEYDFSSLLAWLEETKPGWYKAKYKCIRRIVYSLNDCIGHKAVGSKTRFVYPNDISQFRKVSTASQKMISDYVGRTYRCDQSYLPCLRNYISYYFWFLEKNGLNHGSIGYDDIFRFKAYIRSLNLSNKSTTRIFNNSARFIFDTGTDLKSKIGSLILRTTYDAYIVKASAVRQEFLVSFDRTSEQEIDCDRIRLFLEEMKKGKYTLKSRLRSKRIVYELLFFSFYHGIPLTLDNTLLWSKFVDENIMRDSEHRSYGIKFVEFLQKGTFSFAGSFFDSPKSSPHVRKRQIDTIPPWSKQMADKYIAYRKSLGYRASTIYMDCNSIFRFVTYISNLGIDDYSSVRLEHVLSFAGSDPHSTAEGRNAYIAKVRGFLVFLKDNGVINLYIDSRIIGRFRNRKNLIRTIGEEDIRKITSRQYVEPYETRAYAIFLLGIKCGLRSIDIVNLKFGNISFRDRTLRIVQVKTGKEIVLPVPVIALNAVYSYVKNVRPKSSSEYIFISFRVPYGKASQTICKNSFEIIKKLNGISPDRYRGFHICRKTYASSVINRTKDVDITAYSLGHSDNSTVDDYISIDTSGMHECPLGFGDIGFGGFENGAL